MIQHTSGIHDVPESDYHGDRRSLSVSGAKVLLDCPARYRWQQDNPVHKDAYDFGHVAHELILGKGAGYRVLDFDSWRSKDAREAKDQAHADGVAPILTAEHERAVRHKARGQQFQHLHLGRHVEIDQDVAAEDHVEAAELVVALQQVVLLELDHRADALRDLPFVADLLEMLQQHLDRQAALDLELAVDAGAGLFQNLCGDVGPQNLDLPPGEPFP